MPGLKNPAPAVAPNLSHEEMHMAKSDRGFASMDPEKRRRIASQGGKAAHKSGAAHEWTADEAREAGRKGGSASQKKLRESTTTTPAETATV